MSREIANKISSSCEGLGKKQINGNNLDVVDSDFLDARCGSLHEHIAMQPSLIAYFGMKKKEAERNLRTAKERYDMFLKEAYAGVKSQSRNDTKKLTVDEIKSNICIIYKNEHNTHIRNIEEAQEVFDTFDVYYDAIKQKGYTIKEMIAIDIDERCGRDSFTVPDNTRTLTAKDNIVRDLQRKNK